MRVLVYGGRTLNDREMVYYTLDDWHAATRITLLITGSCRSKVILKSGENEIIWSADELAEQWAKDNYVPYIGVPAIWYPQGPTGPLDKGAGPKRNTKMLERTKPHAAIEFPGGKGTADMHQKLVAAGIIPLVVVAK